MRAVTRSEAVPHCYTVPALRTRRYFSGIVSPYSHLLSSIAARVLASRPRAALSTQVPTVPCDFLEARAASASCMRFSRASTLMLKTAGATGLRGQPGSDGSLPSYAAHVGP